MSSCTNQTSYTNRPFSRIPVSVVNPNIQTEGDNSLIREMGERRRSYISSRPHFRKQYLYIVVIALISPYELHIVYTYSKNESAIVVRANNI